MKKFYYFSKENLKFVEIRDFYKKFISLLLFFTLFVSFFLFGSFLVVHEFVSPDSEVKNLKKDNELLEQKINRVLHDFGKLDNRLTAMADESHDLRLKADLEPLQDKRFFGIGGNVFVPFKGITKLWKNDSFKDAKYYIDKVYAKYNTEETNYNEIADAFKRNEILASSIPAIQPCEGYVDNDFGMRFHPILKVMRMHNGVDIQANIGTKVYAPGDGTVIFAGWQRGYGRTIEIDHGFGYHTKYGHLRKIKVKDGQKVKRGDLIALTGNSGSLSTGPHLHYEIRQNGIALNPKKFIIDGITPQDLARK